MDTPTRNPEFPDVPEKPTPKPSKYGTLLFGNVPAVPVLIAIIWLLCWFCLSNGIITKPVCTGVILATVAWFVVWLYRASTRG